MRGTLPIKHYHIVFTVPHQLNTVCLYNQRLFYGLLFAAVWNTLRSFGYSHYGVESGVVAVLHTWGQNMMGHPHLHCIMPAGGLSFDKKHWVHIGKKDGFFIHYKVLPEKFRGKFPGLLKQAYHKGGLEFKGKLSAIKGPVQFNRFLEPLYKKDYVVDVQAPLGNPDKILEYLSRYVFHIAIAGRRILEVKDREDLL